METQAFIASLQPAPGIIIGLIREFDADSGGTQYRQRSGRVCALSETARIRSRDSLRPVQSRTQSSLVSRPRPRDGD